MARRRINLDPEIQRRARQRASDMGLSLAEYLRRLTAQDWERPRGAAKPALVFDLGGSSRL